MSAATLFNLVLRTPEANRSELLDRACAGKPELREQVEAMLREAPGRTEYQGHSPVLDATSGFEGIENNTVVDAPGNIIAGRYKLLKEIGEGGMGTVWMAQQSEPVKRLVAIKLIKAGMDTKAVLARFDAERQALAMMDHPNIARVLDGGIDHASANPALQKQQARAARPYFVMELVKGDPITRYCDDHKLTLRERLELFVPVCQAIQHAHQKGIIHRDIKPSNVLIASFDDRPVPKVIDFGVAKATGIQLTDLTINTGLGMIVGTPEYMSPEQASMNNLDIDTRSDVYALGVLLYELLTGTTPVDKKSLRDAAIIEVLRIIREDEPPRPSTKVSSSDALPSIAANRHTEPAKLTRLIRGELDWVVLKALEKDRTRRYETANGLARDIQRYLADEAVEARPASFSYRASKFLRRNKGWVLAASLVSLALVAGIIGTTWGLLEARRQESLARQETVAKEKARQAEAERAEGERRAKDEALQQKAMAQKRLEQVEKGIDILGSIFKGINPRQDESDGKQLAVVLGERLDKAAKELEGDKLGDPLAVARLQMTLGESQLGLGNASKAVDLFIKAHATFKELQGPTHADTLSSMNYLAEGYREAGQLELALPQLEETLKLRKAALGPTHVDTLSSMNNLSNGYYDAGKVDKALPLCEEAFELMKRHLGQNDPLTLTCMNNLAAVYRAAGKPEKAMLLSEETLKLMKAKLGPDHMDTLTAMNNLGGAYRAAGKLELAIPLFEETLRLRRAKLGQNHPDTLTTMNNLANAYRLNGKFDQAILFLEEVLKLRTLKSGQDHPSTLNSMSTLASAYRSAGKLDQALKLMEETLNLRQTKLGKDHPDTLTSMNNLAECYQAADKLNLAVPLYEETFKLMKAKYGQDHPDTIICMANVCNGYRASGKYDLALPLYDQTLKLMKAKFGTGNMHTLINMSNYAMTYRAAGQLDRAMPLYEETYQLMKAKLGPDNPSTLASMNNLALGYLDTKQVAKALPLFEAYLQGQRKRLQANSLAFAGVCSLVAYELLKAKEFIVAESYFKECLAIREKEQPEVWSTFNTQSQLGGVLLGQKKYVEAEPLLLKGYESMKLRNATIPLANQARLSEALDRLIQFYTETNKPEEMKKWQAEKEGIFKTPGGK